MPEKTQSSIEYLMALGLFHLFQVFLGLLLYDFLRNDSDAYIIHGL